MDKDVIAISNSAPNRTSPFRYVLCPNTLFDDGIPIVPQLDQTIITCGEDGSSSNECTIVGGRIQVDMNINSTSSGPFSMKRVDFYGLIFSSAENETSINDTISIQASASGESTAYFTDCHWKSMTNRIAVLNTPNKYVETNDDTIMTVALKHCSFSNTDSSSTENIDFPLTTGLVSINGTITMEHCTVINYNVSKFLDISGNANVTITDTYFIGNTLKDPNGFQDFLLLSNGNMLLTNVTVQHNSFSNFLWIQSGGVAEIKRSQLLQNQEPSNSRFGALVRMTSSGASITMSDTFLHGRSFALITISGLGGTLQLDRCILDSDQSMHSIYSFSNTTILNSCFHGQTVFPPVFISGDMKLLSFANVFNDVDVRDSNCTHFFVEEDGDGCFYPADDKGCNGQCLTADGTSCFDAQLPGVPTCNVDCNTINNVTDCFETLFDLRCGMCSEAKAVLAGEPLRELPYTYRLCENTNFEVVDETRDTIYPILNDTRVICGDGDVANNCTIFGGFLQVEISDNSRDVSFLKSPLPLMYVSFEGIVFKKVKLDPRTRRSASVWARGGPDVTADFSSCRWTEIGGTHAILNHNPSEYGNFDGSAAAAMTVNVTTSNFGHSSEGYRHKGILTTHGRIILHDVDIIDYLTEDETIGVLNNAVLKITKSRITNITMPSATGRFKGFISVRADSILLVADSFFSGSFSCLADTCLLRPGGVIVGVNAEIRVKRTIFEDIVAQVTIGVSQSDISILDSCFVGGRQIFPVHATYNSTIRVERSYGDNLDTNCSGIFIETEGIGCIDPSFDECLGDCVIFNSTNCTATSSVPATIAPSALSKGDTLMPSTVVASPTPTSMKPSSGAVGFERSIWIVHAVNLWLTYNMLTL